MVWWTCYVVVRKRSAGSFPGSLWAILPCDSLRDMPLMILRPFYCVINHLKLINTRALVKYSRKQEEGESVDSFIDKMQTKAQIVGMSGDTLQLAILNGLQLHLSYVVRADCDLKKTCAFKNNLRRMAMNTFKFKVLTPTTKINSKTHDTLRVACSDRRVRRHP